MAASRPRIGVTRWEDVPGERIEDYWERIAEAGGEAVDLRGKDVSVPDLDGLILTGGLDIDPSRYGEEPHEWTKVAEAERDEYEFGLVKRALDADLTVLCICRGSQLLNVALGGSLLQNIESANHRADYRTEGYPSRWHTVTLAAGSKLREVYGGDEIETNSRHHQGVTRDRLAPGLRAVGLSSDGIVEAAESMEHRWAVGVQWHPERPEREQSPFAGQQQALFRTFVGAARTQPEGVRSG